MKNHILASEYFFRGLKMLKHPKIRLFVIVPLIINILLMFSFLFAGIHYAKELIAELISFLPAWLAWLSWLLWLVFSISFLLFFIYAFTIISNIISAPFNALLSEKVAILQGHNPPSAKMTLTDTLQDVPRSVGRACRSLFYFIPRALVCLILLFIPLVQIIVPVLWFLLNAWMMSVQYMDYPMDNNKVSFSKMLKLLNQKRTEYFSLGSCILLATMIPIVNLIVMPAAVIAATLFYNEHYMKEGI